MATLLGRSHDRAALIAKDLASVRMRVFENIADTQLPALAERYALDHAERDRMATWVDGARPFMAGNQAWHLTAAR
ncbi:hypothetical protein ACIRL2_42425 [Embleya sp. NPDC127516]|uniref:hypothetical protein n=1 Tax=Embleya sp. NPDC127516 TaxID=3363990 RepID=UPI0038273D66